MRQFEVRMKCTVYKTVTVECETIEQAEDEPWDHVVDEVEIDQIDWEALDVEESK